MSNAQIQADFDRLALVEGDGWSHNRHYHPFLLRQLSSRRHDALDIGCGTGAFARLLAERCEHVLALDLSPQMIRLAREHSSGYDNIDYQIADAMDRPFGANRFDCIASIATLHHLPLEAILQKAKSALRPQGVLVVLDLYQGAGLADAVSSLAAIPVSLLLRWIHTGRLREPREVREAWEQHGRHDHYLPLRQIRQICARVLPDARVRKHLLWRYSIVWGKADT